MSQQESFARKVITSPAAPASALLFGHLFLYKPALIYQSNAVFFYYGFLQLALPLLAVSVLCAGSGSALALAGPPRWRRGYTMGLTAVAIAAWFNSAFFAGSSGTLDGRTFAIMSESSHLWGNALILSAVAAAVVWLGHRYRTWLRQFCIALNVVFISITVIVIARDTKPWRQASESGDITSFSSDRNVLLVVLDAFQADLLEDILTKEPDLASELDGFTFFTNAVGVGPTTYLSIPAIHSGRIYVEGLSLRRFYRETVESGSFLSALAHAGYRSELVNPILGSCPGDTCCYHGTRIVKGQAFDVARTASGLLDLSLFRIAPHFAKTWVFNEGAWRVSALFDYSMQNASNEILDRLATGIRLDAKQPTAKFLHLFNTHAPVGLDAECQRVSGREWIWHDVVEQDRCALRRLIPVFRALREKGGYDRTAIAVLADHGAGLHDGSHFELGALASPLVLAKPFEARGKLARSGIQIGLVDIAAIVCGMTRACTHPSGVNPFSDSVAADRSFKFLMYSWTNDKLYADSIAIDSTYVVIGPPREQASWLKVFSVPPPRVSKLSFGDQDPAELFGVGWSDVEDSGGRNVRWALGSDADVYLNLAQGKEAVVELEATTHAGNEGQTMSVTVNDVHVATLPVNTASSRQTFRIPGIAIAASPARVRFHFSKWNRPSPSESRPLAVLFDELTVDQE